MIRPVTIYYLKKWGNQRWTGPAWYTESPSFKEYIGRTTREGSSPVDEEIEKIGRIVASLNEALKLALKAQYATQGNERTRAKSMCCSVKTFRSYLREAEQMVDKEFLR